MTPRRRTPDPRIAVFCRCGAVWFGRHTRNNPVIEVHLQRHDGKHGRVSAAEYEAQGWRIRWPQAWTAEERKAADSAAL